MKSIRKSALYVCIMFIALFLFVGNVSAVQNVQYVGDRCWVDTWGTIYVMNISFVGYDSLGYDNYIYSGKQIIGGSSIPINGNCSAFWDTQNGWTYKCSLVGTGPGGNYVAYVGLDNDTLNGPLTLIIENIDRFSGTIIKNYYDGTWTLVNCPVW